MSGATSSMFNYIRKNVGKWCRRYYLNSEIPSPRVSRIDEGGESVDGNLPFFSSPCTPAPNKLQAAWQERNLSNQQHERNKLLARDRTEYRGNVCWRGCFLSCLLCEHSFFRMSSGKEICNLLVSTKPSLKGMSVTFIQFQLSMLFSPPLCK